MKAGNLYLTATIGGVNLYDEAHANVTTRQWIFEQAPSVAGSPGKNNYYIYSVAFAGALMRLQVRWITNTTSNEYQKNLIGFGNPIAIPGTVSTQVFSIGTSTVIVGPQH